MQQVLHYWLQISYTASMSPLRRGPTTHLLRPIFWLCQKTYLKWEFPQEVLSKSGDTQRRNSLLKIKCLQFSSLCPVSCQTAIHVFQIRHGPIIFFFWALMVHHMLYATIAGASCSDTRCVLQQVFQLLSVSQQLLFIHACSGISGSPFMRLDSVCSAECQQL